MNQTSQRVSPPKNRQPNRSTGFSAGFSAGFSVIETLIAFVIMTMVFIGIVPLFERAMASNHAGGDSSQISNISKSIMEDFYQVGFDDPRLTLDNGATETEAHSYWDDDNHVWVNGAAPTGTRPRYTRVAVVRQYGVLDMLDDGLFNTPIQGGSGSSEFQLKEIEVTVRSESGVLREGGQEIVLRTLKPF